MPKVNIYLPDDLADAVRARSLPVSTICQRALREEITKMDVQEAGEFLMEDIIVRVGKDRGRQQRFSGHWLVDPDNDLRSALGYESDLRWGVAATARGRVAVYCYHLTDQTSATLEVYGSVESAIKKGGVPESIGNIAASKLGEVITLDI